jgi:hypothetical protein
MPDFQIFEYRPRIICPVAIRLALRRTSIVSFLGFPSITALACLASASSIVAIWPAPGLDDTRLS